MNLKYFYRMAPRDISLGGRRNHERRELEGNSATREWILLHNILDVFINIYHDHLKK